MTLVLTDSDKNAHFLKSVFMYHCIHTWIYLVLFFGFIWILRLFILWPPPQLLPARTTIYFIKFILVLWKESPAAHHSVVRRVNTEGPWKATTISSAMERRKKGKRGIHYSGFEMASAVSWSILSSLPKENTHWFFRNEKFPTGMSSDWCSQFIAFWPFSTFFLITYLPSLPNTHRSTILQVPTGSLVSGILLQLFLL